jgi:hypothetical protein
VVNTADEAREVAFDVEIPKTAFISDFAMCVLYLTPTPHPRDVPAEGQSGQTVKIISSLPKGPSSSGREEEAI